MSLHAGEEVTSAFTFRHCPATKLRHSSSKAIRGSGGKQRRDKYLSVSLLEIQGAHSRQAQGSRLILILIRGEERRKGNHEQVRSNTSTSHQTHLPVLYSSSSSLPPLLLLLIIRGVYTAGRK